MSRPVIAVDIDDVLSTSAAGFADFSNKRWNAGVTAEEYDEDWTKFWNISLEEAVECARKFHDSGAVAEYRAIDEARSVLLKLKERYDLIVVTSRRLVLCAETNTWVKKFFPGVFQAVHSDKLSKDVVEAHNWNEVEYFNGKS